LIKGVCAMTRTVLIVGSAPDAVKARGYCGSTFDVIVAINNAWRIRSDWTHLVHAGDFPDDRKPVAAPGQSILSHQAYVPSNNQYGGVVYAGGTMAFSTAYWVLDVLSPDMIAFCGCDMIYDQKDGRSHFYGKGRADPLRSDPTLQHLEAKSNRLMLLAARDGCVCVNLSELSDSRLTFPRIDVTRLGEDPRNIHSTELRSIRDRINREAMQSALRRENVIGLVAPDGDYWNHADSIDPAALSAIDRLWLSSVRPHESLLTSLCSTHAAKNHDGPRHHSMALPS
jgi:hypothetical protein